MPKTDQGSNISSTLIHSYNIHPKLQWFFLAGAPPTCCFQNDQIHSLISRIWEDRSGWWYFRETLPHIYIRYNLHIICISHSTEIGLVSSINTMRCSDHPSAFVHSNWGEPRWFDELHSGAAVGLWFSCPFLVGCYTHLKRWLKGSVRLQFRKTSNMKHETQSQDAGNWGGPCCFEKKCQRDVFQVFSGGSVKHHSRRSWWWREQWLTVIHVCLLVYTGKQNPTWFLDAVFTRQWWLEE